MIKSPKSRLKQEDCRETLLNKTLIAGKMVAGEEELAAATREAKAKTGLPDDKLEVSKGCSGTVSYTVRG